MNSQTTYTFQLCFDHLLNILLWRVITATKFKIKINDLNGKKAVMHIEESKAVYK